MVAIVVAEARPNLSVIPIAIVVEREANALDNLGDTGGRYGDGGKAQCQQKGQIAVHDRLLASSSGKAVPSSGAIGPEFGDFRVNRPRGQLLSASPSGLVIGSQFRGGAR